MIWSPRHKRPLKEFDGTLPGASDRIFQNQTLHDVGLQTVRGGGSATVFSMLLNIRYFMKRILSRSSRPGIKDGAC